MNRCTFAQASQPLPPLDFVIPGLLAGTGGLIVGSGGVGKTNLALHIGIGCALGKPICAGTDDTALYPASAGGQVVVILGEDPEPIILHRQQALIRGLGLTQTQCGLLDETLEIYSAADFDLSLLQKSPSTGEHIELTFLKRVEQMCQGRRLLILDPLLFFAGGLDESSNGDMGALMRALNRVAHRTGCAILVLHHTGKSGASGEGADSWEKARGASALTTAVRLQINLTTPTAADCEKYGIPETDRGYYARVYQAKANYSAPRDPVWLHKGSGGVLSATRPVEVPQAVSSSAGKKGARYGTRKPF
jgi:RecA-family ATPase